MSPPDAQNDVLFTNCHHEQAESRRVGDGEVVVYSRRALGKTIQNQDAALVCQLGEDMVLIAIADGCGGMPSGGDASRVALQVLVETCQSAPLEDPTADVLAGFDAANKAVLDMKNRSGTTLVAALVRDDVARVLHVGDSLAMIVGQRSRTRFVATPHSPTGFGVQSGLLTEREALLHEDRRYVSNIVGSHDMFVEVGQPVSLRARDTLLLASDGLSDNLLTDDIASVIRAGDCTRGVETLAQKARACMETPGGGGHPDDLTMLAYRPRSRRRTS
ncbi:MAG: PP2C family protein-serine/threonine phosphatase [Planctomycetota bacterium]|jgi:serine/threonine protein phosphatase PrpC